MGMKIGKQKEKLSVEISFQLRIFSINKKFHILNLFRISPSEITKR